MNQVTRPVFLHMEFKRTAYVAAVGAVTAGPMGAVIGGAAGLFFDWLISGDDPTAVPYLSNGEKAFMPILTVLVAASRVTGVTTPKAAARVMAITRNALPTLDENRAGLLIGSAHSRIFNPQQCAEVFQALDNDTRLALARDIYSILLADSSDMGRQRIEWLRQVVERSGLETDAWLFVEQFYVPADQSSNRNDALTVLGLNRNASEDEIRTAYRAHSRDYHPDTLASATPAIQRLATEKMKEINDAYAFLTKGSVGDYFVHQSDGTWVSATFVEDHDVTTCFLCGSQNRLQRRKLLSSRCGVCHAQLALPKQLVDEVQNRGG